MKDFFVILTILLVVFGGNHFIHGYIEESGRTFLDKVNKLEKSIKNESSIKNKEVLDILKLWENNEKKWIMIAYHQEINDIEDLLIECYSYYLQGDEEGFEVSFRKLKRNVEDMGNREIITFTNIL